MRLGTREIFVYYRIDPERAATSIAAVQAAQTALMRSIPGLAARLLRRPAEPHEVDKSPPITLMEIYAMAAHVQPAGVDRALQARIEDTLAEALGPDLPGTRHVEVFEACVS